MAFNLAEAAGLDKIVSNLDTMEITMVPMDLIDTNPKNFFSVDGVQDLAESIQVNGILQPLNLVRAGDRYRIIAGHRRFKAAGEVGLKEVPAIILPDMSESMEWFMLIKTNTTARELTYVEKAESAARLKKHLVQMKAEGVKITGRLRDIVAEQLEISKTELARMEVIDKNLIPEAKTLLKSGRLNPSAAYAMAKTSAECQTEILEKGVNLISADIEEYSETRALDWIEPDCPFPVGCWQHELKNKGQQLQCPGWRNVQRHKAKGHPEDCPGCCMKCEKYDHGYRCPDVCTNAKDARRVKQQREEQQRKAQQALADTAREKELFLQSRFVNIGPAVIPRLEQDNISLEDVAGWWEDNLVMMLPDDENVVEFDEGHVASMLHAETFADVDYPVSAFVAFCDAVDMTPNDLLGYNSAPASGGWHPYPETLPKNGQKVVVRRQSGYITRCGEYVYRNGEWYEPCLDDFKLNISGVTHWIECPEV